MENKKKHYNTFLILILFLLILPKVIFAFGTKYAGSFLKNGIGVREMNLGGAVVSNPQSVSAAYWNPAVLAENLQLSGQFMHTEEFAGVLNLDQFSIAIPPCRKYAFGMIFLRSGVDNIPLTENALLDFGNDGLGPEDQGYPGPDSDGSEGNNQFDPGERIDFGKVGTFGASENAFIFSIATKHSSKIYFGGSAKTLYKNLYTNKALGIGFDIGLLYLPSKNYRVGLSISDIITTFLFWDDGEKETILPSLQIGNSYKYIFTPLHLTFIPSFDLDLEFQGKQNSTTFNPTFISIRTQFGLETLIKDKIFLRLGKDGLNGKHMGLGIKTNVGNIDYGFALGGRYETLGNSHRIGLTIHIPEFIKMVKKGF